MSKRNGTGPFHVGDHVRFEFGMGKATGVVVEAVGPIGVRGRHLYRVSVPQDPEEPMTWEMPGDSLELLPPETEPPHLAPADIAALLANGGLMGMLLANREGGPRQPRAWACLNQLGNLTYTFYPERGLVGGQVVPDAAVYEDRIYAPKLAAVTAFVRSFGLSAEAADAVIRKVRVGPKRLLQNPVAERRLR